MDDAPLLDSLFELICDSRVQNASTVAAFTILTYDWLLTFNKEVMLQAFTTLNTTKIQIIDYIHLALNYNWCVHVNLVGESKLGHRTVSNGSNLCSEMYVTGNQYIPEFGAFAYVFLISLPFLFGNSRGGPIIFTTLVNIILGLRLYALYQSSKLVLALIIVLTAASIIIPGEFSAEFWGSVNTVILETKTPLLDLNALEPYIPGIEHVLPGCTFGWLPSFHFTLASYIPNLFVSGIYFCLIAYSCFKSAPWKSQSTRRDYWGSSNGSYTPENIIAYIIRDGIIFFLLVFSTVLIAMMTTVLLPKQSDLFVPFLGDRWIIVVYSLAGTKLILNLREAAHTVSDKPAVTEEWLSLQNWRGHTNTMASSTAYAHT
ncbi:hypothetical protein GYMLUDRAFT_59324 [Collybiopsis luxurians FD-317 M1]|uniref:Uncharacterized protein n=1 Tax=Collybiopsis luxurians FD-317 M1 TaxID=944289 RepID=A0A0D0CXK4_9AGAR|nr:hypothetical protein GYMLUDRAFT_59324 [Collybiopsis luxurians FD-317 M1]